MRSKFTYIIPLLLLLATLNDSSSAKKINVINSSLYFPVNNNITLVYESTFGESITKYIKDGEFTISSSKADKFKYRQTLIIKEDGVYVKETYQLLNIFLFIKKEGTFTYNKPLLRFPLPLSPGMVWEWEGKEYSDGDRKSTRLNSSHANISYAVFCL